MNNNNRSTQAFKTLLTSYILKKNTLTGEINRLLKCINEKKQLILKFEGYNDEYNTQLNEKQSHSIAAYINNETFLNKIAEVLINEKENLRQLEQKNIELIEQYNNLAHKIEKIQELLDARKAEHMLQLDKKADNELAELAVNRNIYKDKVKE